MKDADRFTPPDIKDEDIVWAADLLGLPDKAFHGKDGDNPRQEVLKSMQTTDVAACPGSGKTTLLVAKLAILANKWRYRTRGICVLSHTNAARHEIENRLGNTGPGRRLLSYPHFVGTIHGFVNQFLALPWLRSQGHRAIQFSTEISGSKLWRLSGHGSRIIRYLKNSFGNPSDREPALRYAHYVNQDRDICLEAGNAHKVLRRTGRSSTFASVDDWKAQILDDGYAAYEDTFAYGSCAMQIGPWLCGSIRDRFPVLFIDEAQDNNQTQSAILHKIFMEGDAPVIRQRFGDANQAIYGWFGEKGATEHAFPDKKAIAELPDSHRFGQAIADLADPLGLNPYRMKGLGPKPLVAGNAFPAGHTIFVFSEADMGKVLGAYARLLLDTFDEDALRSGVFTAVGQTHRPNGDDHRPRHVQHYWPEYDPELARSEPKPQTFVQYVISGQAKAWLAGSTYPAVEKIAEGVLRLSWIVNSEKNRRARRRNHLYVLKLLEAFAKASPETCRDYQDLIEAFALNRETLTATVWNERWRDSVRKIAEAVAEDSAGGDEVQKFLSWPDGDYSAESPVRVSKRKGNIFPYTQDGRSVDIRVGSIHSVKGETHTATLVLETFWNKHNIDSLMAWLQGCPTENPPKTQNETRLKVHYVAMTRPTHLLCLAIKKESLEGDNGDVMRRLEERGWTVKDLSN